MDNISEAVNLLRKNGFTLVPPKSEKGLLFVIKYIDEKGNIKYSYRKNRYSGHATEWPDNAQIAEIKIADLDWKPLVLKSIVSNES
jgi:hypothetical protein